MKSLDLIKALQKILRGLTI